MHTKKLVSVTVCGVNGEGRTSGDAKRNAEAKLTAFAAAPEPEILTMRDRAMLLYRTVDGWVCRCLQAAVSGLDVSRGVTVFGEEDYHAVYGRVRFTLAQMVWTLAEPCDKTFGDEAFPAAIGRGALGDSMREELLRWIELQRRMTGAGRATA